MTMICEYKNVHNYAPTLFYFSIESSDYSNLINSNQWDCSFKHKRKHSAVFTASLLPGADPGGSGLYLEQGRKKRREKKEKKCATLPTTSIL